jgi:AraC-like DNA-binding protein
MNRLPSPFRARLSARCGRVRCEPGWHLDAQWAARLRDFDLWFVHAGRGSMSTSFGTIALTPGVCLWMRPGRRYEATQDLAAPLTVSFFHFDLQRAPRRFIPPFEMMHVSDPAFVGSLLQRVLLLNTSRSPVAQASAETLFSALLAELARESADRAAPAASGVDLHHREIVQRLAAEIRENSGKPRTIAELAQAAGYSVDHFSRVFEKVTGLRPRDFLIDARVARARQLLAETALTVGQIAEALGYRDVFFFSRQFRHKTGQTPTQFRTRLSHSAAAPPK